MEVPSCKHPVSKHLPENVIQKCIEGLHTPINPHSQRLLTAEARAAGKVPKAAPKKKTEKITEKSEPKKAKTVKGQPEKDSGGKKKCKTEQEKQEASGVSRTTYATAKKEFMMMDELLASIHLPYLSFFLGCALLSIPSTMLFISLSEVGRIHAESQRAMVTKLKPALV